MVKEVWSIMAVTLPVTCLQLGYLILISFFIIGNIILTQTGYGMDPFEYGFFGWLLVAFSCVFGLVALAIYIADHDLIRCKCNRK